MKEEEKGEKEETRSLDLSRVRQYFQKASVRQTYKQTDRQAKIFKMASE